MPRALRIAVLVNPADVTNAETNVRDAQAAARATGLQIEVLNAETVHQIDSAFETMARGRHEAIFVATAPYFVGRRIQLAQLAAFHRLPATYSNRLYAEAGGLMSYGADPSEGQRLVGSYTGRILKGAKPADLPVVQVSKLDLVINANTARMLGLTVPPTLLATADDVIE